jgi:hypothetical protein
MLYYEFAINYMFQHCNSCLYSVMSVLFFYCLANDDALHHTLVLLYTTLGCTAIILIWWVLTELRYSNRNRILTKCKMPHHHSWQSSAAKTHLVLGGLKSILTLLRHKSRYFR